MQSPFYFKKGNNSLSRYSHPLTASSMKRIIIIPTYNESENIGPLAEKVFEQPVDTDILYVDDNSPDGTGAIADAMSKKNIKIKVLHRQSREGLGRAYIAGFEWALENGYDILMQMDADLSHDPAMLPVFFREIERYDAIFGSRYLNGVRVHNWSFKRLLLSKASNEFIRVMLHIDSTDTTTAYKCFRRKVIEAVDFSKLKGKQNAFLIELVFATVTRGFTTKEIPFTFTERETGESKMNPKSALESLCTVLKLSILGLFKQYRPYLK